MARPETRTEAERVDAITKLVSVGVPQEAAWERVPGVTPQTIERWRAMADEQAARTGLTLGSPPVDTAVVEPSPADA